MAAGDNKLIAFDIGHGPSVCGADEAGRGCLAGPIVAAAVRFDYAEFPENARDRLVALDDSKKLDRDVREELFGDVLELASATSVVARGPRWIDQLGLHRTNLEIVATAIDRVWRPGDTAFSDGFAVCDAAGVCEPVIKGDATSAAIAAASVIAKVTRDRMMHAAAKDWPDYGFERHVGYATAEHREAIERCGPSPLHRMSFASVAYKQLSLAS